MVCLEVESQRVGWNLYDARCPFSFKFIVEEDTNSILVRLWSYNKHYLALAQWKSGFDPILELNCMPPIWVRLLDLLLVFWDENFFRWIRDSFSHYIRADNIT